MISRTTRIVTAVVVGLLALPGLSGCGSARSYGAGDQEIAGGGTTGVYYGYGVQLAKVLDDELDLEVSVAETDGSVENLLKVGAGAAVLGFAQSDAAADAVAGVGSFESPLPIRAVARLYDEYVHVVVRSDSEAHEIADLTGRRFSLGAANSGVMVVAMRVLDAAGVDPMSVRNPQLGVDASIAAMERGEIEGFFWVGGLPTPGIEQLAATVPIRLLSIDAEIVDRVNSRHGGVYRQAEFPAGAYGRDEPTVAMTVPNYLITHADAPGDLIHDALEVLFEARRSMALSVPAVALLDRRQAIFTDPIDLHPGAAQYYSEARR